MASLNLDFTSVRDLQQQISEIGALLFGTPVSKDVSTALFTTEELVSELARRQTPPLHMVVTPLQPDAPEAAETQPEQAAPAAETEKKKRGRPPKAQATVAETVQATAARDEAANEPAPEAAALPTQPTTLPDTAADAVAPSLPSEVEMLSLMSNVYTLSGDMALVRGIMSDVGGKTQLSMIPAKLWPVLRERLVAEQTRLKAAA